MTKRQYKYSPDEGMFVEVVDDRKNVLDTFFFNQDSKVHFDIHGNESYSPVESEEDRALSAAADTVSRMASLAPDALDFLIGVLDAELAFRSGMRN